MHQALEGSLGIAGNTICKLGHLRFDKSMESGVTPIIGPISGPPLPGWGALFGARAYGPGFELRGRLETYDKVLFIHSGRVRAEWPARREQASLEPGSFVWIPAGMVHNLIDTSPATVFYLCYEPRIIFPQAARMLEKPLRERLGRGLRPDPIALDEIQRLYREGLLRQQQSRALKEVAIPVVAQRILLRLAECESDDAQAGSAQRIQPLLDRMAQDYFADWDIERAARMTRLSRRQFTRAFRAWTGTSFLAHLTNLRLEESARIIRQGRTTIAGAAFCCGFQDLSHFYRLFRRRFGMPPGKFLRAEKG